MARVLILATLSALLAVLAAGPIRAEAEQGPAPTPDQTGGEAPPPLPPPAPAPPDASKDAEQIAKLSSSIAEDTRRLEMLRAELAGVRAEVDRANAEFMKVEQDRRALDEELERLGQDNQTTEEHHARLDNLDKTLALAAERRHLAATDLKTVTEQIATLETKLRQSDQALKKLLGEAPAPPAAEPATPAASAPPTPPPSPSPAAEPVAPTPSASPAEPPSAPPASEPTATASPTAALPGLDAIPGLSIEAPASSAVPSFGPDPDDPELKLARQNAQGLADAVQQAETEVIELTERLETIDEQLRNEEQARDTARRTIDNAEASGTDLAREYQEKLFGRAPEQELDDLRDKIRENNRRLIGAREESREHGDEILRLQAERGELASQLQLARWRAESTRSQFSEAESTLKRLENPFSPENIIGWLLRHGLNVVAIFFGMILLRWGSGLVSRRIVTLLSARGQRGTTAEKEHRISTLVGVFDNAASVAVVVGGFLMIFQEVGVPVGPLLGGAAVFGLAVAFGAQNLIRDYFYGFVILLENQYKLNDVIKIRDIAGQVEAITLRVTVLRDLEGCVHFIPNGEITQVTNMTHGWSRALFDIGVAYKENVDRVMEVILEVGRELRKDPQFRMLILEDPTMLGVDAFADSAVMIKFFIKTRPLQQWTVKRELLRRLKNRFDELGIEIPFPHRTVYHRTDDGGSSRILSEPHLPGDEVIVAGRAMPGASTGGR